ncbi:MAG: DUF2746 domain-containing protein [Renibacterium salmoninarum]|nr:DUF2746 domain-containing protein [Renibacterium salmoninarum]
MDWVQIVVNVGAVCVAVGAVIGVPVAVVKVWPIIKRLVAVLSEIEKLPETLKAQNEVLGMIQAATDEAVKQVQNSHVTNLRDDVDAVRDDIATLHAKVDAHLGATPPPTMPRPEGGS